MKKETLELPALARNLAAELELEAAADNGRRALKMAASSDIELERWFGVEILDHSERAVDMSRFDADAVPFLFNHDWNQPIGIIKRAALVDGRLEAEAELFDTDRGREVAKMIDGGLRNISVGYEVQAITEIRDGAYRVDQWQPFEISFAPVPADYERVGIGRNASGPEFKPVRITRAKHETASTADVKGGPEVDDNKTAPAAETAEPVKAHIETRELSGPSLDFAEIEKKRKASIIELGRANNIDPENIDYWIQRGYNMDQVAEDLIKILTERGKSDAAPARIGMSRKEVNEYSVMKAIRAAQSQNWRHAGLELEAHRALMERDNLQPKSDNSVFIPMDVQARTPTYGQRQARDFNVAGAPNLVGTDHLAGSFIDLLRNASVAMRMGATRLTGLRGNVAIPKLTAGATAYWLASETTAITESTPTVGQLAMSPKNVAAFVEVSHQMMQQGDPSAEAMLLSDLAQQVAIAADAGALAGDGTGGAPTGITNTAGIGAFTGTALDYAAVLDAQVDVVKANAMLGGLGYVFDPDTTAKLMTRVKFSGTASPIWAGNILETNDCAGLRGMTSNQVAANSGIFGAWATLVMAEWGVLELAVNPNQNFAAGTTGLRAWYTMDVGLRYAGAFSATSGVT